jgi:hypothetical protein
MNALSTMKCLAKTSSKKVTVFWHVTQYSLTSFIDVSQQHVASIFLHSEDEERMFQTSVNFNQTARCNTHKAEEPQSSVRNNSYHSESELTKERGL